MTNHAADHAPYSEMVGDFTHLRESISQFAAKRGISQNEAVCHALALGLKQLENGQGIPSPKALQDLSTRQRAVLMALRKGLAVKEIADSLKISEVTVRTHIMRIRSRLDCPDLLKLRMQ
jgi:DNA-binding NarL/FixJ family response regulator